MSVEILVGSTESNNIELLYCYNVAWRFTTWRNVFQRSSMQRWEHIKKGCSIFLVFHREGNRQNRSRNKTDYFFQLTDKLPYPNYVLILSTIFTITLSLCYMHLLPNCLHCIYSKMLITGNKKNMQKFKPYFRHYLYFPIYA